MVSITETCACPRCKCEVDHQDPGTVMKDNQYYCSQSCASGHAQHAGCGHSNCDCFSLPEEESHRHTIDQFRNPRPE